MSPLFDETWFYAPAEQAGASLPLPADEAHHALRVLRLRSGAGIVVTNGAGAVFHARFEVRGQGTMIHVLDCVRREPRPPGWSLALGLLPGREAEEPVAAACEFALSDVYLLHTDHSGDFPRQNFDKLLARLRQKSLVALKQAKKPWLTRIHAPEALRVWRERHRGTALVVAHPGETTVPNKLPSELHLLTGPAGGFSPEEVEYLFAQENVSRLDLGPTRLRAEHAPLAALGNLWGRW